MAGWLVLVAPTAARCGVLPRPMAAMLALLAVVPLLVPFSSPWGTIAVMLAAAVLGVTCLVRARSAV